MHQPATLPTLLTPAGDESPRYPRSGEYPVRVPERLGGRALRLAVVTPVCYRYRMPIFRRLARQPALEVRNFVSTGLPGTYWENAPDLSGLNVTKMLTLKRRVRSAGREAVVLFNPTLPWHLLRWRPDVILLHGGEPLNNTQVLAYAKLFRKPIVWWSLGKMPEQSTRGLSGLYFRASQVLEHRCTAFLGYSSMAIAYFHEMGYEPRRCFNLVNVVDTELVDGQIEKCRPLVEPLRERLGLRGKRVVLYVGSLIKRKGIEILLEAFALLGDLPGDARLLIVGDGPQRQQAEALAEQLGIADRTIFVGAVYENVSAYFQLADFLVMPGLGGLVVSEAMTHGLPVIASFGDGCEVDLIEHGRNGFRLSPVEVSNLQEAMRYLLERPDFVAEAGRRSRQLIETKYSIKYYMNEMLASIFFAYENYTRKPVAS